jgi:hypothetical protein
MEEKHVYTTELVEIYRLYRRAKGLASGKGYRMPKDFDAFYEKMSETNRAALYKITAWFKTKWNQIDPERYFLAGFELYKTFTYKNFFDPRVLRLYINKDKHIKREAKCNKENMVACVKFVKKYMLDHNLRTFFIYCNTRHENKCLPVLHYLDNKIDAFFLTWLLYSRLIHLTDTEEMMIPYVIKNYRENVVKLLNINDFLKKLKEKL